MTGVEVLAYQEIAVSWSFSWGIYFLVFAAITVGMTLLGIFMMGTYAEDIIISLIVGCIFGALIGIVPASLMFPDEYETQYKVIISDEVSMNDFLSEYEIIDQEGKIYTVRERNDE